MVWDGKSDSGSVVPDGVYTVQLHAVDAYGQTADASVQLGVDTRTPGALTTPAAGDTLAGLARFVFTPTSGFSLDDVYLSFDTGGSASIYNASPDGVWRTSVYTGSLQSGPAKLYTTVQYTDPFGVAHTWSAPVTPVTIDVTSLPLTVTADPASGPAPLATTLHIDTSDPAARSVHYTVDFGDGTNTSGDVSPPYPTTDVAHTYSQPGAYRAVVTVTNDAGAASTQAVDISATGRQNSPPTATLSLDSTSGVAPLAVNASIGGSDPDNDPLTYTLDFGDGSSPASGSLPTAPIAHTYSNAGAYVVRLAVSDGKQTAVKTVDVEVALAQPLSADAGDDQVASVNTPVHFDGSGSRPRAGIESYHWDFGDGSSADGVTADHTYTSPGTYTAKLTVGAAGQTSSNTAPSPSHRHRPPRGWRSPSPTAAGPRSPGRTSS